MERECFRHGMHERWYYVTKDGGATRKCVCGICACDAVRRNNAKKNYRRILKAQGQEMADAYMSAVDAGVGVNVTRYLNGTAPATIFEKPENPAPIRTGWGAGRQWTVRKFAPIDLDDICVCERCLNPPPPNGLLKAKMLVGPGDGGKKTRDNVMILCPVCRSLTISAMKRSAPPVWTGKDWAWPQVLPQDIENLWIYAAKWMTPEQRVQYAGGSVGNVDMNHDATFDVADPGAEQAYYDEVFEETP